MKHNLKITLFLVVMFLVAQVTGLALINKDIMVEKTIEQGEEVVVIEHGTDQKIERPDVEKSTSFVYLIVSILVGTALLLLLIKFKVFRIWKIWFFLAVCVASAFALSVFISLSLALSIGVVVALLKIYKPNVFTHNASEVLVYSGIAVLLVPIMNLFSAFMLLILISLYDMYAVWKSKHMIKLAEFQKQTKLFAGLYVPYKAEQKDEKKPEERLSLKKLVPKTAILGGGDVAFPLIFSGVVMEHLILVQHLSKTSAFFQVLVISALGAAALLFLFVKAEKDKYYPAMPFVTAGCFLGYLIVWLI